MAGFLSLPVVSGIGQGALQGQQTMQQNQMSQLDMEIKKLQLQSARAQQAAQQAATLRQQNADAAAAGVLQQYYGAQQQAPQQPPAVNAPPPPSPMQPQSPAPGQPSVPMMQPGQQPPPMPPGGPQGQMPPPGTPPLPPGQPGGQPAPQQPPPYRRIATQQQAKTQQPPAAPQQPQAIPQQAPQEGSLNMQSAVQMLAQKGITGPAMVDALDRIKPYLDEEAKQQAATMKQQLALQGAAMKAMQLEVQGKHYEALEANAQARTELEAQRLRIEENAKAAAEADRKQAAADRKQAREDAKIPTGYERDSKTGELKPMKGGPYDPSSPNFRGPAKGANAAGLTVADKMNPRMLATVRNDIGEVDLALDSIKKLQADTTGPFYASDHASPMNRILGRAVTPVQQQMYETAVNRLAVSIATMQSMGVGQLSDVKVREARDLIPQLGDKPEERKYKIEYIKKLRDNAEKILNSKIKGNPAQPDAASTRDETGAQGGVEQPKSLTYDPATGTFK